MTNRRWILLFGAAALLCALWLALRSPRGDVIGVYQDGALVARVDPALVTADTELTLRYAAGESVVHIGADGVYIVSADCPGNDCVRHGPLTRDSGPIVCLPERIVIRWIDGGDGPDAVSGRSAP